MSISNTWTPGNLTWLKPAKGGTNMVENWTTPNIVLAAFQCLLIIMAQIFGVDWDIVKKTLPFFFFHKIAQKRATTRFNSVFCHFVPLLKAAQLCIHFLLSKWGKNIFSSDLNETRVSSNRLGLLHLYKTTIMPGNRAQNRLEERWHLGNSVM